MGLGFFLAEVMAVVCRDQGDAVMFRETREPLVYLGLLRDPVILKLEEHPVAENGMILLNRVVNRLFVVPQYHGRDLSLYACGETDEALIIFPQKLLVDSRDIIEAFEVGEADELAEVLVTLVGLGEEDDVERIVLASHLFLIEP